jgi:hypothetical protein
LELQAFQMTGEGEIGGASPLLLRRMERRPFHA